jgi:pimeloyl-ACP methyl ester carboxylesterase
MLDIQRAEFSCAPRGRLRHLCFERKNMQRLESVIQGRAVRVLLLLVFIAGLWGCARPERTLVITVGGLGFSQMHDLRKAVERQCPDAKVVSAGAWDAYKADIHKIAAKKPRDHIVLIGHSFGCEAISDAAAELPKVDLAVFIDPAWSDFPLAPTIERYLWYKRTKFDITRQARIVGASGARPIPGGHNDLPHSPELIAQVVAEVQRLSTQPPEGKPRITRAMAGR